MNVESISSIMDLMGYKYVSKAQELLTGRRRIPILTYHSICRKPHKYGITPQTFSNQISFIRDHYPITRLRTIGKAFTEKHYGTEVVITFDDGYTNFFEEAFPILEKHAVPCTVFVPSGCIGKRNQWDSKGHHLADTSIMTCNQLLELNKSGLVDFGSHSVDHANMSHLSLQKMKWQAIESKNSLEALFGQAVTMFSYPYGQMDNYSSLTTRVLGEAGYELAVTTHWGTLHSRKDYMRLKRISLHETDSLRVIAAKLDGHYDWMGLKEQLGFCLRTFRRVWST